MTRPRIFIVGARGFLGSYAVEALNEKAHVVCGDREAGPGGVAIDIRQASSIDKAFVTVKPDGVLLLAAMADIDKCEAHPQEAFAVNVKGAEHVASACARGGARLLYASSGAVFESAGQPSGSSSGSPLRE